MGASTTLPACTGDSVRPRRYTPGSRSTGLPGAKRCGGPGPAAHLRRGLPVGRPGKHHTDVYRTARVGACCPRGTLGHQIIQVRPRTRGASAEGGQDMSNGRESDQQLRSAMAELAGNFPLDSADGPHETLERVTAAVELIRGIDHADVLLIDEDRFESVASTDPTAEELD